MLGYLAGFFDGEGCVTIGSNGSVQLRVINTSKQVLDRFPEFLGGTVLPRKQMVNKPQYYWSVYGEDAIEAVKLLLPFSIEKAKQLHVILEWWGEKEKYALSQGKIRGVHRENAERDFRIKQLQEQLTTLKKEY